MGTYLCHNGSVLLSGECATRAAAAEGCLEDRAPGSQVVAQKWHMRGLLPLSTQSLPPAPTELSELQDGSTNCPWTPSRWSALTRMEPLLPSSKKSQTKRRSPTTVTNEVHCPHQVTKLCHLPVTRQGSGLRDLGRKETYLLNTYLYQELW